MNHFITFAQKEKSRCAWASSESSPIAPELNIGQCSGLLEKSHPGTVALNKTSLNCFENTPKGSNKKVIHKIHNLEKELKCPGCTAGGGGGGAGKAF